MSEIEIKEPGSLSHRVKLPLRSAFGFLGKAIVNLATAPVNPGAWVSIGKDAIDLAKEIGLARTLEERAYVWIYSALMQSAAGVLRQHYDLLGETIKQDADWQTSMDYSGKEALDRKPVVINREFFTAPHKLEILEIFRELFVDWLKVQFAIHDDNAQALGNLMEDRFLPELIAGWQKHPEVYQEIQKTLDHPFVEAERRHGQQERYHLELAKHFTQPVINEHTISLAQLYIEPCFDLHERCFKKDDKRIEGHRVWTRKENEQSKKTAFVALPESPESQSGLLHAFTRGFLSNQLPHNLDCQQAGIMLLLGYPGQGKTSFCYRLLRDLVMGTPNERSHRLRGQRKVFFIRLRDIPRVKELMSDPVEELRHCAQNQLVDRLAENYELPRHEFLNHSIWILDGLDELRMKEGLSDDKIDRFLKDLGKQTAETETLQIVLTSRFGYIDLDALRRDHFVIVQLRGLTPEQQINWLNKYRSLNPNLAVRPEALEAINDTNREEYAAIRELIDQPILLHMVVTSNLSLDNVQNRADIYDQLFSKLITREWSKSGQIEPLEGITADDLREYIRTLALAIFHSGNEYIRKSDLLKNEATKTFVQNMKHKDALEGSIKRILVAFYFREVIKDDGDSEEDNHDRIALEFLHKSLQEYMVAERIWDCYAELAETTTRGKPAKKNAKEMMETLSPVTAPRMVSREILEYLIQMIANEAREPNREKEATICVDQAFLFERMMDKLPELLQRQFLLKFDYDQDKRPIDTMRNVGYLYLTLLSVLKDRDKPLMAGSDKTMPEQLVDFLRAILPDLELPLQANFWKLPPETNLSGANLSDANLSGANLSHAYLIDANLHGADLSDANLSGAYLIGANLSYANLSYAKLSHAKLSGADLSGADLHDANLSDADLSGAKLRDAIGITRKQLQQVKSLKGVRGIEAMGL